MISSTEPAVSSGPSQVTWRHWCRLCAKNDDPTGNINITFRNEDGDCDSSDAGRWNKNDFCLADTINKFFSVNIRSDDMHPKELCMDCSLLVATLKSFWKRVHQVQHLFDVLGSRAGSVGFDPIRVLNQFVTESRQDSLMKQLLPEMNEMTTQPAVVESSANMQSQPSANEPDIQTTEMQVLTQDTDDKMVEVWLETPDYIALLDAETENTSLNTSKTSKSDSDVVAVYVNEDDNVEGPRTSFVELSSEDDAPVRKCPPPINLTTRPLSPICYSSRPNKRPVPKTATCATKNRTSVQGINTDSTEEDVVIIKNTRIPSNTLQPICPYCLKIFAKKSFVQIHINTKHRDVEPYLCAECGQTFSYNIEFIAHDCNKLKA